MSSLRHTPTTAWALFRVFPAGALAVALGLYSLPLAAVQAAVGVAPTVTEPASAELVAAGRMVYEQGRLPDGSVLVGKRTDGTEVRGRAAACATCHRNSGYGSVEGTVWVPPITAQALFGGVAKGTVVRADRRYNARISTPHPAYVEEQVTQLVQDGTRADGSPLHSLMPRYALPSTALPALHAYLKTLGTQASPAVHGSVVRIASVITPEVDAKRRQALQATLRAFVQQRNVFLTAGLRKKIPAVERKLHSRRTWELVFWELQGAPETWSGQLATFQKQQPAFALVSGTTTAEWQPMARFCEEQRVACWFPTLEVTPAILDGDRYGLYFSRGVATEAAVIAAELRATKVRTVKVFVPDTHAGQEALRALRAALPPNVAPLEPLTTATLPHELAESTKDSAVVLWGDRALAEQLARLPAPRARLYWAVGSDPAATSALPAAWQQRLTRVDRFEQGNLREANLKRFREWASVYQIAVVDEQLQAEAFFATGFFAATFTDILNNLDPLYLVERAQDTLSMREAERVQMEVNSMMMGGGSHGPAAPNGAKRPVQRVDLAVQRSRQGTTIYSRLSLGPGQHFASQGAFLVTATGTHWRVPGTPGNTAGSNP